MRGKKDTGYEYELQCPECGSTNTCVTDSRNRGYYRVRGKYRRRKCHDCDHRFTTLEIAAGVLDEVKENVALFEALSNFLVEHKGVGVAEKP